MFGTHRRPVDGPFASRERISSVGRYERLDHDRTAPIVTGMTSLTSTVNR